jgi:hypothetical protein
MKNRSSLFAVNRPTKIFKECSIKLVKLNAALVSPVTFSTAVKQFPSETLKPIRLMAEPELTLRQ